MDIHELRQFESVYKPSKEVAFCWLRKQYVQLSTEENHTEIVDHANDSLRIWQAAKAQAVPEGFVLVLKEPYAYLIKHKLWKKDSDPEIFLAVDFLGDDGIEKDKLTVCTPLYLGDDEAQEPAK